MHQVKHKEYSGILRAEFNPLPHAIIFLYSARTDCTARSDFEIFYYSRGSRISPSVLMANS
jgi:hypothetical protein